MSSTLGTAGGKGIVRMEDVSPPGSTLHMERGSRFTWRVSSLIWRAASGATPPPRFEELFPAYRALANE